MGVKAFEMALNGEFGKMVAYKNNRLEAVSITEAVKDYNFVKKDHYLINTARSLGISFGDK
jgi:6-phosphofructokinase 1